MSASASASPSADGRRARGRGLNSRKMQPHSTDEFSGNEDDDFDVDEEEEEEDEEGDWHASESSEEDDERELDAPTRALCIYCNQAEYNDPSTEFELPLECIVCGCLCHRQCARSAKETADVQDPANAGQPAFDEETGNWQCPTCPEDIGIPSISSMRRTTSRCRRQSQPIIDDATEVVCGTSKPMQVDVRSDFESLAEQRHGRKRKAADLDESDAYPMSQPTKRRYTLWKKKAMNSDFEEEITNEFSDVDVEGEIVDEAVEDDAEEGEDSVAVTDNTANATIRKTARVSLKAPKVPKPRGRPRIKKSNLNILVKRTSRRCMLHVTGLNPKKLAAVLKETTRPTRRRAVSNSLNTPQLAHQPTTFHTPHPPYISFPANQLKLDEEPYGGILSEVEADTSRTLPTQQDRFRFDKARQEADEEKTARLRLSAASATTLNNANGTNTAKSAEPNDENASLLHLPEAAQGSASKIKCIHFGNFEIDTWYTAPYPEEFHKNQVLYICEFCLKYMNSEYVSWRHKLKCPAKHPPGDEIYRDGSISVFEVDGRKNPTYCQNLCLLAKLFLGSKTLYYDVDPFLFYIMTECDDTGCHFVGYFSKEKRPTSPFNVSCILTLPIHQRKGYGNLLIDFSYLLSRVEGRTGSPEKPLSDLGLVSYRNYWRLVLCYTLRKQKDDVSIDEISKKTGMTPDDIICALEGLHALVRDPITGKYALRFDYAAFEMNIAKWEAKNYVKLNSRALVWTPFVMGRVDALAPPMPTVAPREGQEEDLLGYEDEYGEMGNMDGNGIEAIAGKQTVHFAGTESSEFFVPPHGNPDVWGARTELRTSCIGTMTTGSEDTEMADDKKKEENSDMIEEAECITAIKDKGKGRAFRALPPPPGKPQHVIKLGHELVSSNEPSTPSPSKAHLANCNDQSSPDPRPPFHNLDIYDIPPSRFQIYPPLPGSTPFRRVGRGGASRGRKRGGNLSQTTPRNRLIGTIDGIATAPPKLVGGRGSLRSRRLLTTMSETLTRSAKKLKEREKQEKDIGNEKETEMEMEVELEVRKDSDGEDEEEEEGEQGEQEDDSDFNNDDDKEEEEDTVKVNGLRIHRPSALRSTVTLRSNTGSPDSPSPAEYRTESGPNHDKDDGCNKDRQGKQPSYNLQRYPHSPTTPSPSNFQSISSTSSSAPPPKFDLHPHIHPLRRGSNSPPKVGSNHLKGSPKSEGNGKGSGAKAPMVNVAVSVGSKM